MIEKGSSGISLGPTPIPTMVYLYSRHTHATTFLVVDHPCDETFSRFEGFAQNSNPTRKG
jgi:hypothetical protein